MVIDNNYTLSICCCADIIISLIGYCTCTDADDNVAINNMYILLFA